jgi:hypothetical protein
VCVRRPVCGLKRTTHTKKAHKTYLNRYIIILVHTYIMDDLIARITDLSMFLTLCEPDIRHDLAPELNALRVMHMETAMVHVRVLQRGVIQGCDWFDGLWTESATICDIM